MDPLYHDYSNDTLSIKDEDMGIDFSKIGQDDGMVVHVDETAVDKSPKKKRTRTSDSSKVVPVESKKDNGLEPYADKYNETNLMLRGAIGQLDNGLSEIAQDISYIRTSKTMKRKYDYLSMLQGTASSLIGNKITAIREMNNSISKAADFELKRAKDMNLNAQGDDDKTIQDMYKAFVTASVPNAYSQLGPSPYDMTVRTPAISGVVVGDAEQDAYSNYVNNMTPQQHMIALENDPNVKQVVLWDKNTGCKSFEIMNLATGEILQNVDKHDIMFMEDTTVDERSGIARNIKLNETYPLIVRGESFIDEY